MKNKRFIFLPLLAFIVTGCGRQNPLLKRDSVESIRQNLFLDSKNFPIKCCANYFAGNKQYAFLQNKCDRWASDYYKTLIGSKDIPKIVNLKDFKDKQFWLLVLSKE